MRELQRSILNSSACALVLLGASFGLAAPLSPFDAHKFDFRCPLRVLKTMEPSLEEGQIIPPLGPPNGISRNPDVEITYKAGVLKIVDKKNPRFHAIAAVFENKGLKIEIFTRDADTGERSKNLAGKSIFDYAFQFFDGRFDTFEALWTVHKDGSISDNYYQFTELVRTHSPLEAAELTWSGQQAVRNGFRATKIKVDARKPRIDVTFERRIVH